MESGRNQSASAITHWGRWLFGCWLLGCAILVAMRWNAIQTYWLPDTDDNMRMAQVRAWLGGQGWYDLRQYKLDPPTGFNIHWSRVVDLPIAGLQLVLRPFIGGLAADRWSAALAPLLPFGVAMAALAVTLRRLIAPNAFVLAPALMFACTVALAMFAPMRVDHHGWQLAMLACGIAGLVDPNGRRGGIVIGLSSALSLAIGLELLPFLAVIGGAIVLHWVWDAAEEQARLRGYAVTLALGCLVGFVAFASNDNRVWRCDVLSPVWTTTMVAAGALALLLTVVPLRTRVARLAGAGLVGGVLAAGFATAFPQCLGAPEQISPELYQSWFRNIREAKPLLSQAWTVGLNIAALPVVGVLGSGFALWRSWGTRAAGSWGPILGVSALSLALCFWQTRNGSAAQLLAIPGAAALVWALLPWLARDRSWWVRAAGPVLGFLAVSTLFVQFVIDGLPGNTVSPGMQAVNRANASCPSLSALAPLTRLPAATIFTFVDLGPRLINTTQHRAIAGPYHRNGDAILAVHHAMGGSPEQARSIIAATGARLLLTCPNLSESTVYRARSPNGFYSRLAKGERFAWLTPVALPANSPYRLWRITPPPA